jgi:hypothetical protein
VRGGEAGELEEVGCIADEVDTGEDLDGVDTNADLGAAQVDGLEAVCVGAAGFEGVFELVGFDYHGEGGFDVHSG